MSQEFYALKTELFSQTEFEALVELTSALYPHDGLDQACYARAAALVMTEALHNPNLALLLRAGLAHFDSAGANTNVTGWLQTQVGTEFFDFIQRRTCFHLYDDREVWEAFGYPGSSFELGGYIARGFNDLGWLPEPRIEMTTTGGLDVYESAERGNL